VRFLFIYAFLSKYAFYPKRLTLHFKVHLMQWIIHIFWVYSTWVLEGKQYIYFHLYRLHDFHLNHWFKSLTLALCYVAVTVHWWVKFNFNNKNVGPWVSMCEWRTTDSDLDKHISSLLCCNVASEMKSFQRHVKLQALHTSHISDSKHYSMEWKAINSAFWDRFQARSEFCCG